MPKNNVLTRDWSFVNRDVIEECIWKEYEEETEEIAKKILI